MKMKETGKTVANMRELRLLGGIISVALPEGFQFLTEEEISVSYPEGERPQQVLQCEDGARFAFTYFEAPFKTARLNRVANGLRELVSEYDSTEEMYGGCVEQTAGTPLGWLDYKSREGGASSYNVVCVAEVGGNTLYSSFTCDYVNRERWEKPARNAVMTICDLTN